MFHLIKDWTEIEDESKFISLYCKAVHELPPRLVCPKLQFFILQSNCGASLNTIPNTFFEGMNQLKVLALSRMHFPTLCLDRCKLGDMAMIGELKKQEVLSMVGSDIQQLPREMMQLTNIRLLDLNYCEELKVIPRDILSSLSRLERLFKKSCFSEWVAEEVCDGDINACLSELNNLHHSRTIEVAIPIVPTIRVLVTFTKLEELQPVEEFSTPLSSPAYFQDALSKESEGSSTSWIFMDERQLWWSVKQHLERMLTRNRSLLPKRLP